PDGRKILARRRHKKRKRLSA
ncbi:MAG: 50S ribosomal protein L34, partial [Bacillota bacterium]